MFGSTKTTFRRYDRTSNSSQIRCTGPLERMEGGRQRLFPPHNTSMFKLHNFKESFYFGKNRCKNFSFGCCEPPRPKAMIDGESFQGFSPKHLFHYQLLRRSTLRKSHNWICFIRFSQVRVLIHLHICNGITPRKTSVLNKLTMQMLEKNSDK